MSRDATTVSISLPNGAATRALGAALAAVSAPGTVILLRGPLGAGKTTLVDGFAQTYGAGRATSPTFVIAHLYNGGKHRLWHVDLYRIDAQDDIADLDLAQYMDEDTITLVEWPERANDLWPSHALEIELVVVGEHREARISAAPGQLRKISEAYAAAPGQSR